MNKRDLKKQIYESIIELISSSFHEHQIKESVGVVVADRQDKWKLSEKQQERIDTVFEEVIEQLKQKGV